ncbi:MULTISPECIES: 3-hydroxyacyl-CoA dehydrogenase/enoyl-CoA hydratase family protein [unclassified Polaromonas]|jgi:3-hydroxyacyl-CoA dehydrogenase|uniref:3-hydroxyacyl-CoA dehydrogenase/enoyl-CoA hydratase family protein n=1 Tax=unclassified Polaromonas TaxID=2638319 RepID=UPI000BC530DD|nr:MULTISPECIES: 3-hydroxyacyl-CoA dehydrogenase/enoyl-CoA hydratase family protein [unclassified Polaromonas]OYY36337.1 MAG: 3-hydroxyacyl-CoA dehydrogenase [Polaromonas sp. 35-63-35]OYZ22572.1 MAG: 3-hydroxyacyl-CoA dehydrogenase [Polaromonas sp. 16-63-31]OYZ81213.1 MAG: 3-hydroxyacyl-CoA dehydrogenase [Polaromonas sp. 24-63-21]OZA52566.1 MAG: 3-hydroxyacyl-CoA dehydrogenase [Polaromonas sp. 17-63-33]OZA88575.1 MAG: 3-hydroxyacyl-CoA dehydrogenase [Polaromonas sp. 39-63-25]
MSRFQVKKVAVLGAGVMGAQIAAHLVNLKVPVVLFDLPAKEGPKNGIVSRAIEGLKKLKPAPLGVPEDAALIQQANYEEHMDVLKECDLIIEAIAERMDWKTDLYHKIAPFIGEGAIVASNTSGLSITKLSEALPESIKPRFCGIHFFNPPRYMTLVELINTPTTDPRVLDDLEAFVTSGLGKGVIRAHDTPNFVANRVGIAGMLATMKEVENFGLTYDVVDDLTGKKLGRASSGTFRTADVVGLDTMAHVIKTLQDNLDEKSDPFYPSFGTPEVLKKLLELGNLGQKSRAGFYKKVGRDVLRFELDSEEYVPGGQKADEVYTRMLKRPAAERLRLLRNAEGPQGQFLWAILRNSFHYAAVHLATIADNARDVDQAMRWGFGMKQGPFELWQEAGWLAVATMIQEDIAAGKALCKAPLPEWVFKGPVAEAGGVHTAQGSWSASAGKFVARRALPVYERQHFPEKLLGEALPDFMTAGTTLHEDDAIRLWTLAGEQGDVLIASIKTKMHAISPDVVEGLAMGVDLAEKSYKGLVIWSNDEMFSAGADLQAMLPAFMMAGVSAVEGAEAEMQNVMLKLRYAAVPVVSAVRGLALGGGCEMAVYSAKRVAAMESYIGLVEVGVGLVPGAGGLTYIARRAAENAATSTGKDILPFLTEGFTAAAMAKVGTSAIESRKIGYLLDSDVIVPHKDELLFVALNEARALFTSGYRAPHKRPFPVVGRSGLATIKGQLVNMRDGGFISAHDFHIASLIANVVCGGDVDAGSLVTEEYVMTLERKAFCSLLEHPKTQERIMGMMSTGKPLRN